MTEFVFLPDEGATANDELARFHEEFLAAGPIEWTGARVEDFKAILTATWLPPIPWKQGGTTCALWQATAMMGSGIQAHRRVNIQYAITTWLKVQGFSGAEWIPESQIAQGESIIRGDIVFWTGGNANTWQSSLNGHVGCVLTGAGDFWKTAEGGGANGRCRLSDVQKNISAHSGRPRRGMWRPNRMASVIRGKDRDTVPAPPPKPTPYPGTPLTLRRGSKGEDVKRVQRVVVAVPDGDFGPRTEGLVKSFQIAHGLTADGVVGPKTLAAILKAEAS